MIRSGRRACRKAARAPAWLNVLKTLVAYRLLDPGSEWRLHRDWFKNSAMADLLGEDDSIAAKDTLYRCLDKLCEHKGRLFSFLKERWSALFGASYDVLLYDLTSTYFECDPPEEANGLRRFGYSRDKRSDCVQVVIALIVTPEGFPVAYEVMPGNTSDKTTLPDFLRKIEAQYGKMNRLWIMDRGIPTEDGPRTDAQPKAQATSSAPRAGGSPSSKASSLPSHGKRCRSRSKSSSPATAKTSTCSPVAADGATRNSPCGGASSRSSGSGCTKSGA